MLLVGSAGGVVRCWRAAVRPVRRAATTSSKSGASRRLDGEGLASSDPTSRRSAAARVGSSITASRRTAKSTLTLDRADKADLEDPLRCTGPGGPAAEPRAVWWAEAPRGMLSTLSTVEPQDCWGRNWGSLLRSVGRRGRSGRTGMSGSSLGEPLGRLVLSGVCSYNLASSGTTTNSACAFRQVAAAVAPSNPQLRLLLRRRCHCPQAACASCSILSSRFLIPDRARSASSRWRSASARSSSARSRWASAISFSCSATSRWRAASRRSASISLLAVRAFRSNKKSLRASRSDCHRPPRATTATVYNVITADFWLVRCTPASDEDR
mmetsp:Transcript_40938/g.107510  ORF Transcript_40938/g.107510 Transcript_40938/m.107510 type:complete len:325 (-) Transcript_40938:282-1256(-)